jgi:hypothetical protein
MSSVDLPNVDLPNTDLPKVDNPVELPTPTPSTRDSLNGFVSFLMVIAFIICFIFVSAIIWFLVSFMKNKKAPSDTFFGFIQTATGIPKMIQPLIIFIFIFIITLILLLANVPSAQSGGGTSDDLAGIPKNISNTVSAVLFVLLLIVILSVAFIPSFSDLKKFFEQIYSVMYVILYTVFLILFFNFISPETLNDYSIYITSITIFIGIFCFYNALKTNYIEEFNINFERTKAIILFFCLIVCYIIFYDVDPGNLISKSFGYSLLLTIITSVFMFLYLIILLTLPNTPTSPAPGDTNHSFLSNFSTFAKYNTLFIALFIIIITIIITKYPGGFLSKDNQGVRGGSIVLILLISITWSIVTIWKLFPELTNKSVATTATSFFKRALLILFGIIISSLVIFWLVYNLQHLSNSSSIASFVINLLLVIVVLGLIYKIITISLPSNNSTNSKKEGFFNMIINFIFYIPCIFIGIFDFIGKLITGDADGTASGSVVMIIVLIILLLAYYYLPYLYNLYSLQGGQQLVNKPVYTDNLYPLATYQDLNVVDSSGNTFNPSYQYAISFWVFLDAAGPNTNAAYDKYTSLLNFGDKPNVLYNGKLNTLMITMKAKDLKATTINKFNEFDENDNLIIYKSDETLLQKWNNIIINYNGGVLDIFLNGVLVKSKQGVVPYYTLDNLTIGENNGIKGGICNVIYFKKPLTILNINSLYNSVKSLTPPTLNNSQETIITYKTI